MEPALLSSLGSSVGLSFLFVLNGNKHMFMQDVPVPCGKINLYLKCATSVLLGLPQSHGMRQHLPIIVGQVENSHCWRVCARIFYSVSLKITVLCFQGAAWVTPKLRGALCPGSPCRKSSEQSPGSGGRIWSQCYCQSLRIYSWNYAIMLFS